MKQTFKEWLELQMAAHFKPIITWAEILAKYNELESQPKFKVGDRVRITYGLGAKGEVGVVEDLATYTNTKYNCRMVNKLAGIFDEDELELMPTPKMKKVFSLAKFMQDRLNCGKSASDILYSINRFAQGFDGLTQDEIERKGFITHEDWMIEVEE